MARPRKWESDAERMRAKRAAENSETSQHAGSEPSEQSEPTEAELLAHRLVAYDAALHPLELGSAGASSPGSESGSAESVHLGDEGAPPGVELDPGLEGRSGTPPGFPTEDEYVRREVEATKAAIARGLKDHDGKRVARARAYARWRYAGVKAGDIARL